MNESNRPVLPSFLPQAMVALMCFLAVFAFAKAAVQAQEDRSATAPGDQIRYKVRKGETCWGIAKKLYKDPWKYKTIARGDQQCPDSIYPGQWLTLPSREAVDDAPDAKIAAKRGDVEAKSPKASSWDVAKVDQDLWRAWRVSSGDEASAQVAFLRQQATLEMRENTLVVIFGSVGQSKEGVIERDAVLEKGTLRSRLGELAGGQKSASLLHVETPGARAEFAGGDALITVVDQVTLVANHTASVLNLTGHTPEPEPVQGAEEKAQKKTKKRAPKRLARKIVKVPKNMGSKVEEGKDPTPPKPLPAAPTFEQGDMRVLSLGSRNTVMVGWQPVKTAGRYRVELRSGGGELLQKIQVSKEVVTAQFEDLPLGTYGLTVASVDVEGFEGLPSRSLGMEVLALGPVDMEKAGRGDGVKMVELGPEEIRLGQLFQAPAGYVCGTPTKAPTQQVRMIRVGTAPIRCRQERTGQLALLDVDVKPVGAKVEEAKEGLLKVKGGQEQVVTLTLDAPQAEPPVLVMPKGVALLGQEEVVPGRSWRYAIKPQEGFTKSLARVMVGQEEVSRFEVAAELARSEARRKRAGDVAIGVYLGTGDMLGVHQVENDGELVDRSLRLGLRGALDLASFLALHVEVETGQAPRDGVLAGAPTDQRVLLMPRVGVESGLWIADRVRPFAQANIGAALAFSPGLDARLSAPVGVGLEVALVDGFSVRADLLHDLESSGTPDGERGETSLTAGVQVRPRW